jgi:hypothetical protein
MEELHNLNAKKEMDREDNRLFLKIQMEEQSLRKQEEMRKMKELTKTNFGPEDN